MNLFDVTWILVSHLQQWLGGRRRAQPATQWSWVVWSETLSADMESTVRRTTEKGKGKKWERDREEGMVGKKWRRNGRWGNGGERKRKEIHKERRAKEEGDERETERWSRRKIGGRKIHPSSVGCSCTVEDKIMYGSAPATRYGDVLVPLTIIARHSKQAMSMSSLHVQ